MHNATHLAPVRDTGPDNHHYVYAVVRTDITVEQQVVQACHATYEAGTRWRAPGADYASLIVLEVPSKKSLMRAARKLAAAGIDHHVFVEPDFDMGESALGTRPLTGAERAALAGYPLWRLRLPAQQRTQAPANSDILEAA